MASSPPPHRAADVRERVRADLAWYLRHDAALKRWPVIDEPWARAVGHREAADGDRPQVTRR